MLPERHCICLSKTTDTCYQPIASIRDFSNRPTESKSYPNIQIRCPKYIQQLQTNKCSAIDFQSLRKLCTPQYGISGMAQEWLCDYLFSRSQQVLFQGKLSSAGPILCGVPQGSILRLLLFILYFNSAMKTLSQCKMLMYADDTVLSCQKITETMTQWLTSRGLIWKKQEHNFTTKVPHYSKNFQKKFD